MTSLVRCKLIKNFADAPCRRPTASEWQRPPGPSQGLAIRVRSASENHQSASVSGGGHHRPTSPMPLPAMPGLRKRLLVSNMSAALCHRAPARKDAGILQLDRGVFLLLPPVTSKRARPMANAPSSASKRTNAKRKADKLQTPKRLMEAAPQLAQHGRASRTSWLVGRLSWRPHKTAAATSCLGYWPLFHFPWPLFKRLVALLIVRASHLPKPP
jgi:hypothetical protein